MVNSLTQEELASRADLTKGYISQLENDTTCPSIATLKDIVDVFGISMQEFFAESTTTADVVFGAEARVQSTMTAGRSRSSFSSRARRTATWTRRW